MNCSSICRRTRSIVFTLLLIPLVILTLTVKPAYAAKEFTTYYVSTYIVDENGSTQVNHDITIKNNLANIFTTRYTLSIGSNRLENIVVKEEGKAVHPTINQTENSTTIDIEFATPAIGKEQEKHLTVSYTNEDIVSSVGRTWEINIPRLANANEAGQHKRILVVPDSFPEPTVVLPRPSAKENIPGKSVYTYDTNPTQSITLLFGDYQIYDLKLNYSISNPTIAKTETEIAIPPDTEYQQVFINKISPEPLRLRVDEDGNWLAIYALEAQEKKQITADLKIKVFPKPSFSFPEVEKALKFLTRDQKFWEVNSDSIKNLADQLKTPANIYNYLADNFVYDYQRVAVGNERLGARQALEKPTAAICMEFTDAFIALARALRVPAREINGYAYSTNSSLKPLSLEMDVLHAWPEYFDSTNNTWIQIDPTWGNTTGGIDYFSKLDFNHITFVRHGQESTYPYPAGTYKQDPSKKDISVEISLEEPSPLINTQVTNKSKQSSPINESQTVVVKNVGNSSLRDHSVDINGELINIDYLPPYAEKEITVGKKNKLSLPKFNILWLIPIPPLAGIVLIAKKFKK